MRKEELKKAKTLSSVSEKLFDSLLKIKWADSYIQEHTVPPEFNSNIGLLIFMMILWSGLFMITAGVISILLIIACYIVQVPEAKKIIWNIDYIVSAIFVLYRIVLIAIAIAKENAEFKIEKEEFIANQEKYKKEVIIIQQEREKEIEKSKKLLVKFQEICDKYSIPSEERHSYNFVGLTVWALNMPEITFETCLQRYFIAKPYIKRRSQEEEHMLEKFLKEAEEFEKLDEENKRRKMAIKLYGQEEEPNINDCYLCGQSTLYYRGVNFMGNMIMEDDNGHFLEVRNLDGYLVDVESGCLVSRF